MIFQTGRLKRKAIDRNVLGMPHLNQKGLTLVEVLVSILILAGSCVYVLTALARSAEVQRKVEDEIRFFPFLANQLAQIEMRVSVEKDPFKALRGSFTEEGRVYQWQVASAFHHILESKVPREDLGASVLLDRELTIQVTSPYLRDGVKMSTLTRAEIPENQK